MIENRATKDMSSCLEEEDRVLRWRTDVLARAGYGDEAAARLALAGTVDLHKAVELVIRGCPPETAVRILL